jgi:LPS-assembly lipoprotein
MWWHERRNSASRIGGAGLALALALTLGGCFEPMYAEHTFAGKPGLRSHLSAVVVDQIPAAISSPEARVGTAIRNALIFNLVGGGEAPPPTHRLKINITGQRQQVIVDIVTARPAVEMVGISATYSLTDIKTGAVVLTGTTTARASYDIPGQEQRFAGARGQTDTQDRNAKVIADNITTRLASYFSAGS